MMDEWKEVLLYGKETIKRAAEILNQAKLKIIIVIDDNERLLGTITDGDIRRGILNNIDFSDSVKKVMNSEPLSVSKEDKHQNIYKQMQIRDILHVPILDNKNRVVGIFSDPKTKKVNPLPNHVVLMAGGFGKRLKKLTTDKPKPLLKLGDKPILETILISLREQGFSNFHISTFFKGEMIKEYFGDGSKWDVKVDYITEPEPLGTAGALGLLDREKLKDPILIMNGDLLTKINFLSLLKLHSKESAMATSCTTEYSFEIPFGVVKIKDNAILSISEKPRQKFFVNAGIYLVNPELLDYVDGKSYLDMPTLFQLAIDKKMKLSAFPIFEYWLDVGNMNDYHKGRVDFEEHFIDR